MTILASLTFGTDKARQFSFGVQIDHDK